MHMFTGQSRSVPLASYNPNEYATATAAEKIAVDRTGQTEYIKVKELKPDLSGTVEMIYTIGSDSDINSYVVPVNSPIYKPTGYSAASRWRI